MSHTCCDRPLDLEPIAAMFEVAPADWWRFIGCGKCNAGMQQDCQSAFGPAWGPHVERVRAAQRLHGVLWLLTHGYAGDVLGLSDEEQR